MNEVIQQKIDQLPLKLKYFLLLLLTMLAACGTDETGDPAGSGSENPVVVPTGILDTEPPSPPGMQPDSGGRVGIWEQIQRPHLISSIANGNDYTVTYLLDEENIVFEYTLEENQSAVLVCSKSGIYVMRISDLNGNEVTRIEQSPK